MPIAAEFSRPLQTDAIPREGIALYLEASPAECSALATRFDLVEVVRLRGDVRVDVLDESGTFHVAGRLTADVVQACVVTLEPVAAQVEAEFDRLFSRAVPAETAAEIEIDPEAAMPEPLLGDRLDLGEVMAEELSLALDPYPRSPDADRHLAQFGADPMAAETRSPFVALGSLRRH